MESKICKCKKWSANIDKLNNGFGLMIVRAEKGYTGEIFSYCPWCGEKLKIICHHCNGNGFDNFGSEEMPDLDDCLLCGGTLP